MTEKIWFTSDTHFSHDKIQSFCRYTRFQGSMEEHDTRLISKWNSRVGKGDRVYHLGDFSFGSRAYTEELLPKLNGQIHLIYGNHDEMLRTDRFKKYFASRQDYKEIRIEGIKVVMFHFPVWEWNHCHYGSFHLFGHVHHTYGTVRGKSLNVGIDNRVEGDMLPWSWEEVKAYMADKPIIRHH